MAARDDRLAFTTCPSLVRIAPPNRSAARRLPLLLAAVALMFVACSTTPESGTVATNPGADCTNDAGCAAPMKCLSWTGREEGSGGQTCLVPCEWPADASDSTKGICPSGMVCTLEHDGYGNHCVANN